MDEQISAHAKVPGQTAELLNPKENYDYSEYRKQLYWWLLTFGKDPEKESGYALATVKNRGYLIDRFYRQLWKQDGEYRTLVSHEEADAWFSESRTSFSDRNGVQNGEKEESIRHPLCHDNIYRDSCCS